MDNNVEMIKLICDKCSKEYEIKLSTYQYRLKANTCNYCKECMHDYLQERRKNYYASLSDEEKKVYANKRNWINRLSEDEKKAYSQKVKTQLASRSKEEWDNINKKNSEGLRKHWKNVSAEEKAKRIQSMKDGNKLYYNAMTPEERSNKAKHRFDNLSPEEQEKIRMKLSTRMKAYNKSLPKEIHLEHTKVMQKWHNKLTPEQKKELYYKTHKWYYELSDEEKRKYADSKKLLWDNLSTEEKANYTKNALSASSGKNKLNKRFEKTFNESHLHQQFYFQPEVILHNNGVIHSWDYGIFSKLNNELVMVVDLDGSYYHGDSCDYNGIHSKEEYDEKRSLSVSNNIKICIIQEINFMKCFESMIKMLMMDYDEYVDNMFKSFRMMPFPVPHYSDIELLKSYSSLVRMNCNDKYHSNISLNTRVGDRLIMHFHESIWQAHTKGKISPYEAWHNDDLLRKVIKNRILYQTYLNPNKILQGFNISKVAPKISIFSAGRAKLLIHKYLNEFNEIFDPFSGFSGRMLGALSLNKRYVGQDISDIHVNESNQMIEFLNNYKKLIGQINVNISCANILTSYGTYDCLFTCPPYEDKEQWLNVLPDKRTCDDWIDICLNHFKCKRYLFIVDNTNKYQDYIVDIISNKSHFGNNSEMVILIER